MAYVSRMFSIPAEVQSGFQRQNTPTSHTVSSSGQRFLPWQEAAGKQLVNTYTNTLDRLFNTVDQFAPNGGALTGASDFAAYLQNVGGQAPDFTNVPIQGVFTPQDMQRGINQIGAESDARAATQQRSIAQGLRPGFGSNSALQQELLANAAGREAAISARDINEFRQNAAVQNAQHELQRRLAQTNVENLRSADDRQRRSLGLQARGQDLQYNVGLLGALTRLAGGLGGGLGGFLSPLAFNQQESATGPNAMFSRLGARRFASPIG